MTASELRIGNYMLNTKLGGIVHFTSFHGLCNYESKPHEYEPIELTEEWLLKFGFELNKSVQNNGAFQYIYKTYEKKITEDLSFSYAYVTEIYKGKGQNYNSLAFGQYYFDNWNASDKLHLNYELKYVHQLQNLYFALTGEELTAAK
jgi:hypothetical protein